MNWETKEIVSVDDVIPAKFKIADEIYNLFKI